MESITAKACSLVRASLALGYLSAEYSAEPHRIGRDHAVRPLEPVRNAARTRAGVRGYWRGDDGGENFLARTRRLVVDSLDGDERDARMLAESHCLMGV